MSRTIQQFARKIVYSILDQYKLGDLREVVAPDKVPAPAKEIQAGETVLAELGFAYLLTFRHKKISNPAIELSATRCMLSADGTTTADMSQARWKLAHLINVILTRILFLQWRSALSVLKSGFGRQTYLDLESELADGSVLRTSNRPSSMFYPQPGQLRTESFAYGTAFADIATRHAERVQQENAQGNSARRIHDADDKLALQRRVDQMTLSAAVNGDWVKEANPLNTGFSEDLSYSLFAEINRLFAAHRASSPDTAQSGLTTTAAPASLAKADDGSAAIPVKKSFWKSTPGTLLSALAFFAVGAVLFSVKTTLVLMLVVGIHEGGHFLAMLASGYRDVKVFFVPGLGGVTIGQKTAVSLWQRIFVLLAGPVPGIVLGFVLFSLQTASVLHADWLSELAFAFIAINLFNLLPIVPLDGGLIVEAVLSDRWAYARFALIVLSLLPLVFLIWVLHSNVTLLLLVFAVISLPVHFRMARVLSAYRRQYGSDVVDMDTAFNRLFDLQQQDDKRNVPLHVAVETAHAAAPMLLVKPAGWRASLAGMALYVSALLILPVAGAVAVIHSHQQPNLAVKQAGPDAKASPVNLKDDLAAQRQAMLDAAKSDNEKWEIYIYDAQEDSDLESTLLAWDIAKNWPAGDQRRITTLLALANARKPDEAENPQRDKQFLDQARDEITASTSLDHEKRLSLQLELYLQDRKLDREHMDSDLMTAYASIKENETGMYQASIRQSMAVRRYAEGKPDEAEALLMQTYRAGMTADGVPGKQPGVDSSTAYAAREICLLRIAQGHPESALALATEALSKMPHEEGLTQGLLLIQAHAATMLGKRDLAQNALDELQAEFDARDSKQPRLVRVISWIYSIGASRARPKVLEPLLIQQLDTYRRNHDRRADSVATQIREMDSSDKYFAGRLCKAEANRPYELEEGEASWSSVYDQRLVESLKAAGLCPDA